jgi:hypothetical protein
MNMSSTSTAMTRSTDLLQNRDYTVILARTSPDLPEPPAGCRDYWEPAQEAVLKLAHQCEALDPDGITLYVSCAEGETGSCFHRYDGVTSANLVELIQANYPPRQVNLQTVLQSALDDYFDRKAAGSTKSNGEIMLVVLDGEPSDRLAVAKAIVHATQKIEWDEELGIGFVQIGQDMIARGFFEALDNHLQNTGAKFDIVHTKVLADIQPDSLTSFLLDVVQD